MHKHLDKCNTQTISEETSTKNNLRDVATLKLKTEKYYTEKFYDRNVNLKLPLVSKIVSLTLEFKAEPKAITEKKLQK